MKKRIISLFLALVTLLGILPVTSLAAPTLEEAMAEVDIYARNEPLDWLTMNGSVKEQHYTYYNFRSEQTGQVKEVPAYCVDPRLYGVPALVPEGTPIKYTAPDTVSDPKVCGIIANGYPHEPLSTLNLNTPEEAYYATKTALWIYLLGNWSVNGLGINPRLTGADRAAAERVLEATRTIYNRGMGWNHIPSPKFTATADQDVAYPVTINGQSCYQQIITISSDTWAYQKVKLSLDSGAPAGTKILDMNNQEITELTMSTYTFVDGHKGQCKIVYPASSVEGQTGTVRLNMNTVVVQYQIYYARSLQVDQYGNIQDYMLDTDPYLPVEGSFISRYSEKSDESDDPPPPSETGIKVIKLETGTLNPLEGAVFKITGPDGTTLGSFSTQRDGTFTVPVTQTGHYTVEELSPPKWHLISGSATQHVQAVHGKTAEVTFYNDPFGNLRVEKYSNTGDPLEGVTIQIKHIATGETRSGQTGLGGVVEFTELKPGGWEVRETAGIEGWLADTDTIQTVSVVSGETSTVTFTNKELPGLKIIKYDRTTLKVMTDIPFEIWRDGVSLGQYSTNQQGEILIVNAQPGTYLVREVQSDDTHITDTTPQQVELHAGDGIKELTFFNDKKPLLTLSKIDADTQKPIPNTVLTVKALDGTYQDDWKTGPDGKVSQIVDPGVYEVTEKSVPAPYYIPDKDADRTQTITLSPNDEKTLVFRNRKAPELTIFKENSITGEAIEHAKFHVTYTSNGEAADAPATIDYGEVFTDSRGEIKVHELGKRLYPGEFTITEVEPADGFQLKEPLTQTVIIHGNESKTVRFQNTPLSALVVWKYDSVTSAPVEGAIFQVRYMSGTSGSGGTVIGTYKTGPGGSFTINRLKAGAYLVEELASDGDHVMDTAPQTAYISGKEQDVVQLYFGNSPKGAVLIKKIDSVTHEPLSDCEFFITDSHGTMLGDANGKFVTDSAGTILISNIDPGTTIVARETRAKDNYILDDVPQTATIKAGQTVTLEFRNQPKGSVTLYKYSSLDRRTPLEGVGFKITYADGKVVDNIGGKLSSNGIYYTDSEGQINISGVTGTLIFTEVSTIPGYLIDENRKSQTIVVNPNDHQSVYFYNIPENTLIIEKYLETESGNEPLKGMTFLVTDSSGAVVGNSNGEFITGDDGRVVIAGVEPGTTVNVQEIKVPEGVVLDSIPKSIKISDDGANILRFYNKKTGYLVVRKLDSITKQPLAGVEFELTYADGSYVDDAFGHLSSKGRFVTNDAGEIRVPVVGTIVVKEVKTLPTHVIDQATQIQTVKVNPADTQTITVYNEPLCSLTLRKVDATTGKPVPNTEFTLKDGNGTVLGRYTTGSDGTVTVTGLIPNSTIVVVETKVPANYVLDPTPRTIIVRNGSNSVASGGTSSGGNGTTGNGNTGTVGGGNDLTVENAYTGPAAPSARNFSPTLPEGSPTPRK